VTLPVPLLVLVLAGTGILGGLVGSVASLASLVSYPVLLALGLPPVSANVTNTLALVFSGVGSVAGSRPELTGQGRRVARLGLLTAVGGAAGAALLLATPSQWFTYVAPVLIAAGAVAILRPPAQLAAALPGDESVSHEGGWGSYLILFGVAVYIGYFGAAGGILLLAVLIRMLAEPLAVSNAVKNAVAGLANAVASIGFAIFGPVRWEAVLPLAAGFLIGGWIGPALVRRLPAGPLRIFIACCGLALAVRLGISAYRLPARADRRCLIEGVVERPVLGPPQVREALVELGCGYQPGTHRLVPHSRDHGSERVPREPLDQRRPGRVDVHRPRPDRDVPVAGRRQQRLQLPSQQPVAARRSLQFDQAPDRGPRCGTVRMKERRPVVTLDHRDGAARCQHPPQPAGRRDRVGQVLQHEADEEMIERAVRERQVEQVGLAPLHSGAGRAGRYRRLRTLQRPRRDVHRREAGGRAARDQVDRLRADSAAHFQHPAPGRVRRVGVQQPGQAAGLVTEPSGLAGGVPVQITECVRHCFHCSTLLGAMGPWTGPYGG
jgi:hypothetical protein